MKKMLENFSDNLKEKRARQKESRELERQLGSYQSAQEKAELDAIIGRSSEEALEVERILAVQAVRMNASLR